MKQFFTHIVIDESVIHAVSLSTLTPSKPKTVFNTVAVYKDYRGAEKTLTLGQNAYLASAEYIKALLEKTPEGLERDEAILKYCVIQRRLGRPALRRMTKLVNEFHQ